MTLLAPWAKQLAHDHLSDGSPRRWHHDLAVIDRAQDISQMVGDDADEADVLVAAAALHDLGHSPAAHDSGFTPLDAALYLRSIDAPDRLVNLVATHACACLEADLRGLGGRYTGFVDEGGPVRDALWYCCLTTSATGTPVTLAERTLGWASAYAHDEIVQKWAALATDELAGAITRTEQRIRRGSTSA